MPDQSPTLVPVGVVPATPYTVQDNLLSTASDQGASLIGVQDVDSHFASDTVQGALDELWDLINATRRDVIGLSASSITLVDAGSYFVGETVETAMQEIGLFKSSSIPSIKVSLEDVSGFWNSDDVEGAMYELGAKIGYPNGIATLDVHGKVPIGQMPLLSKSDVGLDSVENAAASSLYVPLARTINGHSLSDSINITKSDVGLGLVENTNINTWEGSASVSVVGTIRSGVWEGDTISLAAGGTGASNASMARSNLGVGIDVDVLAYSPALKSLSQPATTGLAYWSAVDTATVLPLISESGLYAVDASTLATYPLTASGRSVGGVSFPAPGAIICSDGVDSATVIAGNSSSTRKFLTSTGDGENTALPAWTEVSKSDVGLGSVENTALSTWEGAATITTVGTITSGSWCGAPVSDAYISSADVWNATVPNTRSINGYALDSDVSLGKSDVGLGLVENIALSAWAGSTAITVVGDIVNGSWSGTPITVDKGGTGQTTANAGFNALSPMTALGDIIYGGASGSGIRLAGNTTATKKFLRQTGTGSSSAAPTWDTVTAADVGLGSVENAAASSLYVPLARTINGNALSANITLTKSDVGLGSVENAVASSLYVPLTRTVNARALTSNITLTKSDVGLGSVENTALSTWTGSTTITTIGTLVTGSIPAANTTITDSGGYYTATTVEGALQEIGSNANAGGVNFNVVAGTQQTATFGRDLFNLRYPTTGSGSATGGIISSLARGAGNNATGLDITAEAGSSGLSAKGVNISVGSTTVANTAIGVDVSASTTGSGTATGLRSRVTGGASVNTGLYASASGGSSNYAAVFPAGSVGIGTATPSQKVEVQDGVLLLSNTGTAAELRFTEPSGGGSRYTGIRAQAQSSDISYQLPPSIPNRTGENPTGFNSGYLEVASTGAMSWRHSTVVTATLDFPSTPSQQCSDLTVVVTGASSGDCVSLGVPSGSVNNNSCFTAWVSASNTVTVRFNNYSGSSINPASGTFKILVTK